MKNTAKYAWSFSRNSSFLRGLFYYVAPCTDVEGDQSTPGKKIWRKKCGQQVRYQVRLQADGCSSTRLIQASEVESTVLNTSQTQMYCI